MLDKVGNKLRKLIGIIFLCYWIYTIVSVVCLDRNIVYYKRCYEASNLRPVMGVIGILYFWYWISGKEIWKKTAQISEKQYYGIMVGISIAAFIVQMVCMHYISKPITYDFEHLRKNAMSIAYDNVILESGYFSKCPNNKNILYVFTVLLKIFKNWNFVIILGILMINISVLIVAQISYQMTKKKAVGMGILVIGILLLDFSYRTFVPYTDNYSVLFLTIPLYAFFNHKSSKKWLVIASVSMAIGCFIKITSAIFLIAGIIVAFLYKIPSKNKFIKNSFLFVLIFVCAFGGMTVGCKRCLKSAGFIENTDTKWGLWHYFMMGQNEETVGAGWKADREYSSSFETLEERNAANRAEGVRRIVNRKIRNNIRFYTYKNFQNYGDGCFAPVQKTIKGAHYGNSFIERIFIKGKQYYHLYALVEQTLWLLVLILVLCGSMSAVRQEKYVLLLQLIILGVSAYTLLFEGRAKYLFMFVPVYLLLAAVGLNNREGIFRP